MLSLDKISKSYGENRVLEDFSYKFLSGHMYKVSGPNGAGKTTLLKIINGSILPDSGRIAYNSPNSIQTTLVDSNSRSFIHRISVYQNLVYFAALNKQSINKQKILKLLHKFNSTNILQKTFSTLSTGQMQLVALIRGLIENPDVLLLDECLINLDEEKFSLMKSYLEKYIESEGRTLIFCSHSKDIWPNLNKEIVL